MNILITGTNGQLGSEFKEIQKEESQHNFYFTDVKELDITNIFRKSVDQGGGKWMLM